MVLLKNKNKIIRRERDNKGKGWNSDKETLKKMLTKTAMFLFFFFKGVKNSPPFLKNKHTHSLNTFLFFSLLLFYWDGRGGGGGGGGGRRNEGIINIRVYI